MQKFKSDIIVATRRKPKNLQWFDESVFKDEYLKEIGSSKVLVNSNLLILFSHCQPEDARLSSFAAIRVLSHELKKTTRIGNLPSVILDTILMTILPHQDFSSGIWIVDKWSHDYFHWVTEGLTKILLLSYLNINEIILLPNHYKQYKYIKESLQYFNIPYAFLAPSRETKIKTMYRVEFDYDPGNFDYRLLNIIVSRIKKANNNNETIKVWISRLHAKKRRILNEIELYPVLTKHNVRVIHPETFSFAEQVTFFQQVSLIVGLHGAGLTNMLFMHSKSQVIEVRKKDDYHSNCYFALASDLQHDYYYLMAEPVNKLVHEGDCILDPAKLDYLLKQIE